MRDGFSSEAAGARRVYRAATPDHTRPLLLRPIDGRTYLASSPRS